MTDRPNAEQIIAAFPKGAYDRLTQGGDRQLSEDLTEVILAVWQLGYRNGLSRGGRLVTDEVTRRLTAKHPVSA